MHPEILRELGSQRGSEMRARAQRITLARLARRSRRAGRGTAEADEMAVAAVVDGPFLAAAAEEGADRKGRWIPSGRHAA